MQPAQLGRPRLQGLTEPSYCSQVHRECREPPHGNEGGNVWGRGLHTSYPCMGHKKPLQMLGAQFTEVFRSVPSTRSQAGNLPTAPGKCAQPRRHLGTPGNVQEVGAFCRVCQPSQYLLLEPDGRPARQPSPSRLSAAVASDMGPRVQVAHARSLRPAGNLLRLTTITTCEKPRSFIPSVLVVVVAY